MKVEYDSKQGKAKVLIEMNEKYHGTVKEDAVEAVCSIIESFVDSFGWIDLSDRHEKILMLSEEIYYSSIHQDDYLLEKALSSEEIEDALALTYQFDAFLSQCENVKELYSSIRKNSPYPNVEGTKEKIIFEICSDDGSRTEIISADRQRIIADNNYRIKMIRIASYIVNELYRRSFPEYEHDIFSEIYTLEMVQNAIT